MRVALADDALILREGLSRLLTEAGFEVVGLAADGDALLELIERTRPDVAIIDIRMPPTHTDEGLRAAKIIRERWPAIGILVLSQHVNTRYASNCSPPGPTASAISSRSESPTSTSCPPASTASGTVARYSTRRSSANSSADAAKAIIRSSTSPTANAKSSP